MKSNLSKAYWGLLIISQISSCMLFIIVASEATKLVDKNDRKLTTGTIIEIDKNTVTTDAKSTQEDRSAARLIVEESIPLQNKCSDCDGSEGDQKSANVNNQAPDSDKGESKEAEGLPDIPATPAVITLGEKTSELLIENQLDEINEDDVMKPIDLLNKNQNDSSTIEIQQPIINDFVLVSEVKTVKKEVVLPQEIPPDEVMNKIDDSGGGGTVQTPSQNEISKEELKDSQAIFDEKSTTTSDIPLTTATTTPTPTTTATPENNLTVEENPIPVFSEWAQKQMEEAEKKLEKQVVNSSYMKKNATSGSKPQLLKIRAKNYASPDCGAKIIASNSEAQNTGALLTSSKDEYMLSPCTNRIWFVVELCEAIQAEKIDLANFELFSSSPKNFSVSVSNRFPTREWSNVGRFLAEDQRNIQSFELYPHLFGKFVRVDIHSHYNSEHFCPISLFRVYGTSEFEAFETENRLPVEDVDEFDDDDTAEQGSVKNENNLFKSASDAVMSIVKKAAEVLVKTNPNKTDSDGSNGPALNQSHLGRYNSCFTPKIDFKCDKCEDVFVTNVNYILSCKYYQLTSLLSINMLRKHIISSQICANRFSLDTINVDNLSCSKESQMALISDYDLYIDEKRSFLLNTFTLEYLAAMCHILTTSTKADSNSSYTSSSTSGDAALNLTIDQKSGSNKFLNVDSLEKEIGKKVDRHKLPKLPTTKVEEAHKKHWAETSEASKSDEGSVTLQDFNDIRSEEAPPLKPSIVVEDEEPTQIPQPPTDKVATSETADPVAQNVNIFNIVDEATSESGQVPVVKETADTAGLSGVQDTHQLTPPNIVEKEPSETVNVEDIPKSKEVDSDSVPWENIENILQEQTSSESEGVDSLGIDLPASMVPHAPQKHHSESVFLRLSNRVKALERNMSLSGQYLEELSRRYKKQVEELQHSFAKTLSAIEEQNKRTADREQQLFEQNKSLRADVEELSNRLSSWISLVICLGSFVVFQVILVWYLIRSYRIHQLNVLRRYEESGLVKKRKAANGKKLCRRKSVEGVSGHPSPTHKVRRPSEEAMRITGSYKDLMILEEGEDGSAGEETKDVLGDITRRRPKPRHRKTSVFYGRRNGTIEETNQSINSHIERQDSAPGSLITTVKGADLLRQQMQDDKAMLEEDYESYIPGTDLAYNEFMPEGPSGAQVLPVNGKAIGHQTVPPADSKKPDKVRRLSSPGFLKSPFSRNNSKKSPHGPTGWEWYRLKKSDRSSCSSSSHSQQSKSSKKVKSDSPKGVKKLNGFGSTTPNSSISEIIPRSINDSDDSIRSPSLTSTTSTTNSNTKKPVKRKSIAIEKY